jgi:dienelactone hydrolase
MKDDTPITTRDVAYEIEGRTYTGYLAAPPAAPPLLRPAVLVLHGGGGLGPQARRRAEMLAEHGYVAFAADLFGERVEGVDNAKAVVRRFTDDWPELRKRCGKALDVLCAQPGADRDRTAAIGFCFGGQAALEFARSGVDLRAVAGFHSQLDTRRPEDSAAIKAKVLICLGDQDCFVFREHREAFVENMTESQVDCQMLLFCGVGHSFTDPYADAVGLPGIKYDAQADRRSWTAMLALFDEVF